MKHPESSQVTVAAALLQERFGDAPRWAVVLGSGLGAVHGRLVDPVAAPYPELGLPGSTVVGHEGVMRVGLLGGHKVALCCGRVHHYEGRPRQELVRTVRALHAWGVRGLVITASVGTVRPSLPWGGLGRVTDHINLLGSSPIAGPAWATRFPDPVPTWRNALGGCLADAASSLGVAMPGVVYAAMPGPAYETPAEIRMLGVLGADVVGMSLVPEALAAAELGIPCGGVVVMTNPGSGLVDEPPDHASVLAAAAAATVDLGRVLETAAAAIVGSLDS
jgi:inosine/guanosine/xanthosine phosphorylase family protein